MTTCPQCGATFTPTHRAQVFCAPAHLNAFYNVESKRGRVLMAFAQTSRRGKSGYTDTRKYALRQFNALLDRFNAEDRASGRNPELIVARKMVVCWSANDISDPKARVSVALECP